MNEIPRYDNSKTIRVKPGDVDDSYEIEEFKIFLTRLIEEEEVSEDPELGIVKLVLDKGTEVLSEKQFYHLKNVIERTSKKCSRCDCEFSWTELNAMEGSLCSGCQHDYDRMQD